MSPAGGNLQIAQLNELIIHIYRSELIRMCHQGNLVTVH